MKINSDNLAIIVGFLVVISIILYFSGFTGYVPSYSVAPYSDSSHFLQGHAIEGFHSSSYSTYVDNQNIDNPMDKFSINPSASVRKLRGFDGLYPSPDFNDQQIDHFVQLPGSLSCEAGSLSNSKGYLCLGPNEVKLLTTRGGNAAGNNFEQSAK
jgi:hypothetical protein